MSLDVEALYCSIPHKSGLAVVKTFLGKSGTENLAYNEFVLELLDFILHNNVFVFMNQLYLQVQSVAMWTSCSRLVKGVIMISSSQNYSRFILKNQ